METKRAAPDQKSDRKAHSKRPRHELELGVEPRKITSPDDAREALKSQDNGLLTQALTALRNQLTIRPHEVALTSQDERLLLAKGWLDKSPGARDIFSIIDRSPRPSPTVVSLGFAVVSALLNLLSTQFIYHACGELIIKNLLAPSRIRQLNSNLSEASSELILSTLKVFNAMSTFAGGVHQRSIVDGFSWGQKSLQKLLFMRRKGKSSQEVDPVAKPGVYLFFTFPGNVAQGFMSLLSDIRTLYIFFILSFLSNSTATPIKLSILEQHRDVFLLIFKGISQDPYVVARRILEVCWEGVWSDSKIRRTLKIGLFSEVTVNHLLKLYSRDFSEDDTPEHIPADLVHHFMLAITTRPGEGICFRSRGWYPRDHAPEEGAQKAVEADAGDESSKSQGGKIYNKILGNIVKGLKANEDARQQELALKILEACPELVAGYWSAANLTLEPRLSSRWITNVSIFGAIISLPIPTASFLLLNSTQHDPSPPPISSVLANILPSALTKNHLTKGLQSPSGLVQHCTALALSRCLAKLHGVLCAFREAARTLEEGNETGQWSKRSRELESEVEKRVPDFMVVIAMMQQKHLSLSREQSDAKAAMLTESALRLLWLYHKLFPRLVAENRFDVGKLLLSVVGPTTHPEKEDEMDTDDPPTEENRSGMDVLRQLHVLRLLRESDQFAWSSKSGSSPHSNLHAVFTLYTQTPHPAVRDTTSDLLSHLLSSSILFSHDPTELVLWLGALPITRRAPQATAPDGTLLTDEAAGLLTFLDDCIQRCIKTPYRYLEDSNALFAETEVEESISDRALLAQNGPNSSPSPLLMTVFEQLRAKAIASLLSPSDTLAIVTFIRKLVFRMTCKQPDLRHAWKMVTKLEEILSTHNVSPTSQAIQDAVRRECDMLSHALHFIVEPTPHDPVPISPVVQEFLNQVENVPIPSSNSLAANAAYELIDWMRLIHPPLHQSEVQRLLGIVLRFSPSAARDFFFQLDPQQGQLWGSLGDNLEELELHLSFEWAYLHSTPAQIAQSAIRDSLASLFFSDSADNSSADRRISIVMHRLTASRQNIEGATTLRQADISLLTSIILRGRLVATEMELCSLRRAIFVESKSMSDLCCSRGISDAELAELSNLVRACLDPHAASDKALALEYCNYWIAQLQNAADMRLCSIASPWIRFMEHAGVFRYLDVVTASIGNGYQLTDYDQNAVDVILDTLAHSKTTPQLLVELQNRSRSLIVLRSSLHRCAALDGLLLLTVEAVLPVGCNCLPLSVTEPFLVSDVIHSAEERWKKRSIQLSLDTTLPSTYLQSGELDKTTARILSGAIYRSSAARHIFRAWLAKEDPPQGPPLGTVVVALHAYLDTILTQGHDAVIQLPDSWFLALVRYLLHDQNLDDAPNLCASCIRMIFETLPSSERKHKASLLLKLVQEAQGGITFPPFLLLIRDLHQLDVATFSALLDDVGDEALKWMAHRFSDETHSDNDITLAEQLVAMISRIETKAHLVEPVVKAVIQTCLHVPKIVQCVIPLLSSTHFKAQSLPATVNRLLQSIVQHSQLYRVTDVSLASREPIIKLIHTLFHLHPTNTCQPSHIAPLARLYGGTLTLSDRLLLSVFHLYEKQRKESTASVFRKWSPSPSGLPSQDTLAAITNLDPSKVFRTCNSFPTRRLVDVAVVESAPTGDEGAYDPVFLTLLVAQHLSDHKELSTTEWVQMFRSNVVSVVICVFSSRDDAFRRVGLSTLAGVLQRVQEADFLEKNQVVYIMDVLRDLLPPSASTGTSAPPRLPMYPVMLLAHALRSTFYPSSFLYPVVSRFLLQRPELDTTDVPMLYSLLYSSEDGEWTRERAWMIRFLTDAVREGGAGDWAVLKRRHTWDLVASMWQATRLEERSLRRGVLEFIANLSSNPHAITSLVLRSSLLGWIEIQLQSCLTQDTESVAWAKILENILVTVHGDKADQSTRGEFGATIARCLNLLLGNVKISDEPNSLALLHLISRVLLRLVTQPFKPSVTITNVLGHAIRVLQGLEPLIMWTSDLRSSKNISDCASLPEPPHHARRLFELPEGVALRTWGACVVALWQVSMSLGDSRGDRRCWEALTCRLLVLRASPDYRSQEREARDLGEWMRREALRCVLIEEAGDFKMGD